MWRLGADGIMGEHRSGAAWLEVKLSGVGANRDGSGARLRIAGQTAELATTAGYASSNAIPTHFGLENRTVR